MDDKIQGRRELTFVPMRNALFLTILANRAEALAADAIVLGVCEMDNANYDDCRKVFLMAAEQYINTALGNDHRGTRWITLDAPLLYMNKAESVAYARDVLKCLPELAYSHTCYAGAFPPCGVCHACVLRAEGFRLAEEQDPLVLKGLGLAS
jgi:7-cyano-7-deazaguanine synthase